jgi:phytoene dehydrogenase-like protein
MKHDFVVIGAGVSGVASALILARNGFRVALVETADRPAPLLRGFSRNGVRFDTGFHYTGGLEPRGTLDVLFRYLGLSDLVTRFPFDEQGFDVFRCVRDGFEFRFPVGYDAIRQRLIDAFPRERPAVEAYLGAVQAEFDSAPYLNPSVPAGAGGAFRKLFGPTLRETLDALTGDETLKCLLSMHCLLYGVAPDEVSFHQHACIVGGYFRSANGILGGGRSLAEAFDARLERAGVDVRCGDGVAGILVEPEGGVRGVRLEGGAELPCGGIVATVHPRAVLEMLPASAFRPADRRRIGALEDTVPAFMLFAVAAAPLPALQGRNLFVVPAADCFAGLGERRLDESPLYVTAAYGDAGGAPRGLVAIMPSKEETAGAGDGPAAAGRAAEYGRSKREAVAKMEELVRMYCPEVEGALDHTEGSTPLTLRRFNRSPSCGLYGVKHKVGQRNPGPATRLRGLYLAGQAVTAPGVLGAALSGFAACGSILGHDRLMKELEAYR